MSAMVVFGRIVYELCHCRRQRCGGVAGFRENLYPTVECFVIVCRRVSRPSDITFALDGA